jgi:hypothetical protein
VISDTVWMRASWSVLALGVVAAAAAVGCGRSGYQTIQNEDAGIYARVPEDWAVYDEADLDPDASERELAEARALGWIRAFNGNDNPTAEGASELTTDSPTGAVQILALPPPLRDALSLSVLRGRLNPTQDPVALASAEPAEGQPQVRVLVNEPVEFDAGFTGVHTVFEVDFGDEVAIVDRTGLRDGTSSFAAFFEVRCNETCYFETHKDEIADLVDSWTIQEVR